MLRLISRGGVGKIVHVRIHRRDDIVAIVAERQRSGENFVHHDADGIEIAAYVGRFAQKTLGRKIRDRADDLSGARGLRHFAGAAGETEIGELRVLAVFDDHDVRRLDVAVDDPLRVRVLERFEDFVDIAERLFVAEFAALERRERLAAYELHHDVRNAGVFAGIVYRNDVRMIQTRHRTRFH